MEWSNSSIMRLKLQLMHFALEVEGTSSNQKYSFNLWHELYQQGSSLNWNYKNFALKLIFDNSHELKGRLLAIKLN